MEPKEIEHIEKNLAVLIQKTKVTDKLKAGLRSMEVITEEEEQKLSALGHNEGNIATARNLYAILITRKNGYDTLQKLLLLDGQPDPHSLLCMGDSAISVSPSTYLKTHLARELLKFPVEMLGQVKSLQETFHLITTKDVEEILEIPGVMTEFHNLFGLPSSKICLHGGIPSQNPLYLERSISDNVKIKSEVFRTEALDKFVFHTRTIDDIKALQKKFAYARSAESQLEDKRVTSKIIYMEQDEDWDYLVNICKAPMHLIRMEEDGFIYLRSSGDSQLLRKYIDIDKRAYIHEEELARRIAVEENNRGICICDIPGMGKTWLLESLARRLAQIGSGFSVYFKTLSKLSENLKRKSIDDNCDHLQVLFECLSESKLASCLLTKCVTKLNHRVILFLDGFDELGLEDSKKMKTFLKQVHSSSTEIILCITSRPSTRKELEETFNVIAHDIMSFTSEDQLHAIVCQWKCKYPRHNITKLEEFARCLITKCGKLHRRNEDEILGIPLKCFMLAKIAATDAKRYSDPNRDSSSSVNITEAARNKTICDLYDTYVTNEIVQLIKGKRMEKSESLKMRQEFLNFHYSKAIETIFPTHADTLNKAFNHICMPNIMNDIFKIGVIVQVNTDDNGIHKYQFLHRTFAEYFVAKAIAEYLTQPDTKPRNPTLEMLLFMKILRPNVNNRYASYNYDWRAPKEYYFQNVTLVRFIDGLLHSADLVSIVNKLAPSFFKWTSLLDLNSFLDTEDIQRLQELFSGQKSRIENILMTAATCGILVNSACMKNADSFVVMYAIDIYNIMECCLSLQLNTLLTLLAKIINTLPIQEKHLFLAFSGRLAMQESFSKEFCSGACVFPYWTLYSSYYELARFWKKMAETGNFEGTMEVYSLFDTQHGNLLQLAREYLEAADFHPVEWAVNACNDEAFRFLFDNFHPVDLNILNMAIVNPKIVTGARNLFFTGDYKTLCKSEVEKQTKILKYFFSRRVDLLDTFRTTLYSELPRNTNTAILRFLKIDFSFQWTQTNIFQKAKRLKHALYKESDHELVDLLVIFFLSRVNGSDIDPDNAASALFSTSYPGVILEKIDMKATQSAMRLLQLSKEGTCFKYLVNTATLKLLIELNVDYRETNQLKRGLLHYSVWNGNLEWVRHLLENGFNVNEKDRNGETPLFFIGGPNIVQMTKLLLDHDADIFAINNEEQNIAHILAAKLNDENSDDEDDSDTDIDDYTIDEDCVTIDTNSSDSDTTDSDDVDNEDEVERNAITLEDFHDWSMLTLSSDLEQVWLMRDREGDSPLHLLDTESQTAKEIVEKLLQ